MNDADLAWVAGVFVGEGTFASPGSTRESFSILVSMTDEDTVNELKQLTGMGIVNGPYQYGKTRSGEPKKPYWVWRVSKSNDAKQLYLAMRPRLNARRREQGDRYLANWDERRAASKTSESFFDANVDKGDCWIWTGCARAGRPVFNYDYTQDLAYRYSYRRYVDPNFAGRLTQTCGNHLCVKPEHLRPGRRSSR